MDDVFYLEVLHPETCFLKQQQVNELVDGVAFGERGLRVERTKLGPEAERVYGRQIIVDVDNEGQRSGRGQTTPWENERSRENVTMSLQLTFSVTDTAPVVTEEDTNELLSKGLYASWMASLWQFVISMVLKA